jgi:hypothetical protein
MSLDSDQELQQYFKKQSEHTQERTLIEAIISLRVVKELVDKNIP